jgi:hypothetical protein
MKFSVAAVIGAAAVAQAGGYGNVSYTTEVVTALTTYCPYSTTLVNNGQTYTVTEVSRVFLATEGEESASWMELDAWSDAAWLCICTGHPALPAPLLSPKPAS